MNKTKLEDYKVEKDKADYLLIIEGRTYLGNNVYNDVTLNIPVSVSVYELNDEVFNKIIDDYVRKNITNYTSYSIKMEEIEKKEELTFVVSISEQDKANEWIDEQRETHKHKGVTSGERFGYQFIPTGLGVCVAVVDILTGKSKDVTDTLNW
tara:strand:- start:14852 stop:15307 length:456 start_codon:yes stop_codon:yes gene_type:complete